MAKFRQIRSHRHLRLRMFGQKRYLRLCTKKPSKWAWTDWNVNYSADSLYTNSKEMASCGKFHSKDDLKNDWIGFWKTKTKLLLLVECSTLSFWILTSHTRDRPFYETYQLLFCFLSSRKNHSQIAVEGCSMLLHLNGQHWKVRTE